MKNIPAVPDFQAVQFSIFRFHRFVTNCVMIATFVTQISHHHWSKTASKAVDDCHGASIHWCIIRETNVAVLSTPFQGLWSTWST